MAILVILVMNGFNNMETRANKYFILRHLFVLLIRDMSTCVSVSEADVC